MSRDDRRSSGPATDARIAEWLNAGLRHHQAGRIAEAQKLYREVLNADADNIGALQLLGASEH